MEYENISSVLEEETMFSCMVRESCIFGLWWVLILKFRFIYKKQLSGNQSYTERNEGLPTTQQTTLTVNETIAKCIHFGIY